MAIDSDFTDIFEVRGDRAVRRGQLNTRWLRSRRKLRTAYANGTFAFTFLDVQNRAVFDGPGNIIHILQDDATSSGASNLGPTNQKLIDAEADRATAYRAENGLAADALVPSMR